MALAKLSDVSNMQLDALKARLITSREGANRRISKFKLSALAEQAQSPALPSEYNAIVQTPPEAHRELFDRARQASDLTLAAAHADHGSPTNGLDGKMLAAKKLATELV